MIIDLLPEYKERFQDLFTKIKRAVNISGSPDRTSRTSQSVAPPEGAI
jgi:hypothetical protein